KFDIMLNLMPKPFILCRGNLKICSAESEVKRICFNVVKQTRKTADEVIAVGTGPYLIVQSSPWSVEILDILSEFVQLNVMYTFGRQRFNGVLSPILPETWRRIYGLFQCI